jgi:sugar (pentulose or hexulose) kinase
MHTAIFDIGKTNKKFSIFDEKLDEIYRESLHLPQIQDEDGFPTEDLSLLTEWMKTTLRKAMRSKKFQLSTLNFSTYGASLVHLDASGKPVAPLYNYLKPFPDHLWQKFYQLAGNAEDFCVRTASPALGMLNSGLQLYWLQQERPEIFSKIKYSLHLPQYCSYIFSRQLLNEYTSIGCHTGLWDFSKNSYHAWVEQTGIKKLFPVYVPATSKTKMIVYYQIIDVGPGIHDSSAALIPYLLSSKSPFLLLSTGTWNITFNPFNPGLLTKTELDKDCLNYMRTDGSTVKASRLFFGNEFNIQTQLMAQHFGRTDQNYHHIITFDEQLFQKWSQGTEPLFQMQSIQYPDKSIQSAPQTRWEMFPSFEDAYHRFMIEMMRLQAASIRLAAGSMPISKLYVDGGFSQSDVFVHLLQKEFSSCEIIISPSPLGSSLGAAMAINDPQVAENYQFDMKRVTL